MTFATIGSDPVLETRERWLSKQTGFAGKISAADLTGALENIDVIFVGVPRGERFAVASEAARGGVHVFLEWPPALSIRECAALIRLAEEAGLEAGVSRPLRFHAPFRRIDPRADLISMRMSAPRRSLPHELADTVDLVCALAGSSSVRRIDAGAVRDNSRAAGPGLDEIRGGLHPAAAFSLRLNSGGYAQALIHPSSEPHSLSVYASGASGDLMETFDFAKDFEKAVAEETRQFIGAITAGIAVPVSALDALHTMRIVERLMGNLR